MTTGSGFQFRERYDELPGIPVTELGDPLEKTFVVATSVARFSQWCKASKVRAGSDRVKLLTYDETPCRTFSIPENMGEFTWVVFVGVEPPRGGYSGESAALKELENRRNRNQFTKAWHYPHLIIKPDVQEAPLLGDPGRDW